MTTAIIDYESGNLHSVARSFERMAAETGAGPVVVTADPEVVARADRIVLPGVGAFADCRAGLAAIDGMVAALEERVLHQGVPFLGICVGMQLLAAWGREHGVNSRGLNWIGGTVSRITPSDPRAKVPHMGWNTLSILRPHPVLAGLGPEPHVYFVHSYHLQPDDPGLTLAQTDHGGAVTAAVGRDNIIGTQFHPEKSQGAGLRLIANFLTWRPS